MADNDVTLSTSGTPSQAWTPRLKDLGNGIRGAVHGLFNSSGTLIDPATDESVQSLLSSLTSFAAANHTDLGSVISSLATLRSAVLAQVDFSNLFVTDGTSYYVRRETVNEGTGAITVSFETLAGAAASPVVANLTPIVSTSSGGGGSGGTTRTVETTYFDATTSGTGITAGDVLARVLIVDLATNSIVGSYWHNMMTGAAVTPAAGTYVEQAKSLATGAAKDSTLSAILTALGTPLQAGGAVTVSNQLTGYALDASLQSILTVLQAQRAESLWTDDTGAFFVRIDNRGTITWTDPSGNTSTAPGTGARPAAGTSAIVDSSRYQATASGTGYSTGDYLSHVVTTDPSTGAVIGHFWLDVTTETKLASSPAAANISPIAPLPTGAAKDTTLASIVAALAGTLTVQGVAGGVAQPVDTVFHTTAANRSGTITAGGTAQQLMAANSSRHGFVVQNQSTGDLYISGLGTATLDQNSLKISAGDYYESSSIHVGTAAVSIIGATTGQAFYAREY